MQPVERNVTPPWCNPGVSCVPRANDPIGQRCDLAERGVQRFACFISCHAEEIKATRPIPIVAWSTPHLKATRLLYEIGEDLEFKRRGDALRKVGLLLVEIRELVRFVQKYPSLNYTEKEQQR